MHLYIAHSDFGIWVNLQPRYATGGILKMKKFDTTDGENRDFVTGTAGYLIANRLSKTNDLETTGYGRASLGESE